MEATMRRMINSAIVASVLIVAPAIARPPLPWPNGCLYDGSMCFFNGQSDNGLFGVPVIDQNSITFPPTTFRARSVNGEPQTTSDRLSITIESHIGPFQSIVISNQGTYSIDNGGHAMADGFLYITNMEMPLNPPG